ncbi:helix-turn-helix domain-containing protein [Agrobacterium rosae]|uniref:helix-turn-helix domain-containing protein n=1 Tax=Agrobacterium rosae TaxID=1972867 RepID=UPI003B9F5036
MRNGVVGFSGAKLAEARLARGISSRKALADLMQKAPSTVIRWEDGETAPETSALTELAHVLSMPEDFFLTERKGEGGLSFFRSLAGALKSDRGVQEVRLLWLQDIAAVADHYAYLPNVDVPNMLAGRSFKTLREEEIEAIASDARNHWGLALRPIVDMVAFLEKIGVIVAAETMETTQLDGVSRWGADGRPYILLANDKQSFSRRQFDAAHELGHLLIHRGVNQTELLEDHRLIEDQAHRFASAFLLPAAQYVAEVNSGAIWELERLKARWKVSIKAQIVRLQRLNVIDKGNALRLYKAYSARGYNANEPFDDVWELQQPSLLSDVFRALIDSAEISKEVLRHDLPLLPHDVESLTNLPSGWLSQESARVVLLKQTKSVPRNAEGKEGQVIPLKRD